MPALMIKSANPREARISPSLLTPIPLRHVLLPSGFQRRHDQLPPSQQAKTMSHDEIAEMLQQALDLVLPSDYWSDCFDEDDDEEGAQ
jgi:hypothetical protein